MKLYQMTNYNGNAWANQIVASFENIGIKILQSYDSKVVMIDRAEKHLSFGDDWDYSKTTMKAVGKFLSDEIGGDWNARTIRKALESGEFTTEWGEKWTANPACNDFFNDFFKRDF